MMRILAVAMAFFAALLPLNLVGRTSGMVLWAAKLAAGALAPLVALAGLLLAALGLRRRDLVMTAAGAAASAVAARYTLRVINPPDESAAALGPDWESRIPPELAQSLAPRRWTPLALPGLARRTSDIVFGINPQTGRDLKADLWLPPGGVAPSGLGVIYVHGGAWRLMKKDMFTRPMFHRLAGQGHVLLDIEYTLAPVADVPGMVADVKRAIVWMREHAAEYGVDPRRIALMGGSAGAHLALMAAYTADNPAFEPNDVDADTSVCGVVSFYGPADLLAVYDDVAAASERLQRRKRIWPYGVVVERLLQLMGLVPPHTPIERAGNFIADLVGTEPTVNLERYRAYSPVGHVGPHCPPTLLLQGTADIFGLAPSTRELYRMLAEAGVPARLVEFPDTEHAFDLALPWISPSAQSALYDVERFLALLAAGQAYRPSYSHLTKVPSAHDTLAGQHQN